MGYRVLALFPSRWPPLLFWGTASGLAAIAGVLGLRLAADLEAEASRYGPIRVVPVATRSLAVGDVVRADDVKRRSVPAGLVPRGPIARSWEGQVVRSPVLAGEVVVDARLAPAGLEGAAALVPPGSRAIAVPSGPGGRPPMQAGDRVDLLATVAYERAGSEGNASDEPPTFLVAAAAVVVAVDDGADIVTVAVPAGDAARVAHAVATAAITLALRT